MRLALAGLGMLGAVAVSGGLAGAWPSPDHEEVTPSLASAPEQAAPTTWSCGPGPMSFNEMQPMPEGYLRPVRAGDSRPHQFYLARAMYSESYGGGGYWGGGGRSVGR